MHECSVYIINISKRKKKTNNLLNDNENKRQQKNFLRFVKNVKIKKNGLNSQNKCKIKIIYYLITLKNNSNSVFQKLCGGSHIIVENPILSLN